MKIGIDVGGSHIGIGIVNSKGKLILKKEKDYDKKENNMSYIVVETIRKLLNEVLEEQKLKQSDIQMIGMAFPGTVTGTEVIKAENLGIENLKIVEELQKDFNIPMHLENDAKVAAIAEKEYGSLMGYSDSLFLIVGTGVGGAAFIDGKLLKPKRYPGFEFGHMVIKENGLNCNCGRKGCFESYSSIKRLKEKISNEFNLNTTDGKLIKEFMIKNKENENLNKILNTYIKDLCLGIANLINIFEPEAISIGGSFAHYKEILLDKLEKELDKKTELYNKGNIPKIVVAELKNDAGIIGATLIK